MQMDALQELPDMSNGNRTRKTACDNPLYLSKFLCSEVNILKLGNTIPNSVYFCIYLELWEWEMLQYLFNPVFPGCQVCYLFFFELLLDMYWCIVDKLM